MVQESWPWPGELVGDCGPYSDDDWDNMWEALYGSGEAPYGNRGVIRNWLNELEVTGASPELVNVDTGAALVHGKFYRNTDIEPVAVPRSVGAWREDTIFLRSVWGATQTIRIYRHENSVDVSPYETPVSTDGVVWHIPLAAVRINAAGTITLITDLRDYVSNLMQPKQIQVRPYPEHPATVEFAGFVYHYGVILDAINEGAGFEFVVPDDFLGLVSAEVRLISDGSDNINWSADMRAGACGESAITHTGAANAIDVPVTTQEIKCIDVSAALAGIAAGDLVGLVWGVDVLGTIVALYVMMLVIRYR